MVQPQTGSVCYSVLKMGLIMMYPQSKMVLTLSPLSPLIPFCPFKNEVKQKISEPSCPVVWDIVIMEEATKTWIKTQNSFCKDLQWPFIFKKPWEQNGSPTTYLSHCIPFPDPTRSTESCMCTFLTCKVLWLMADRQRHKHTHTCHNNYFCYSISHILSWRHRQTHNIMNIFWI